MKFTVEILSPQITMAKFLPSTVKNTSIQANNKLYMKKKGEGPAKAGGPPSM
jgi:hypothetical protein